MKKIFFFLLATLPIVAVIVLNLTISMVSQTITISVENISFSENTVIANIGESIKLSPNISPSNATNKELIWESSNEEVIMVNPFGEATFLSFGSAYVTATSLDGNKKASLYFIVTDTAVHSVVVYTLNNQNSLKVGESLQVYSQVFPSEAENKNVDFLSTNPQVATITQQGKIEANSVGTTTIVGTTQDGGYVHSIEIEVYEAITSISLPPYILLETSTHLLDLNLQPTSANVQKVVFKSDNAEIATVDKNGVVVFEKAGIVNITAEYENLKAETKIEYTNGYAASLSLLENTKTINYDQKFWQIPYLTTPTNLYNTEIEFASSNTDVATVSRTGLVNLEGGGASIITASTFKSDGTQIVRQITLFVNRNVEEIESQNIVTASNLTKIHFSVLPKDATSTQFFFTTNSNIASVDFEGNVLFGQAGQAQVTIFEGSPNSSVYKTITITYTGGLATGFEVEKSLTLNANTNHLILANFLPQNTTVKNLVFEVVSETGNDGINQGVISVSQSGVITAIKGGVAEVKVSLDVYGGATISKIIDVNVVQFAKNLNFDLGLEVLNQVYISGEQTVYFSASVFPNDTTDKSLKFEISENAAAATLLSGRIVFNYPSTITLKAINQASGVWSSIKIRYTNTILQVVFKPFVNSIKVGQSALVEVESFIPSTLNAEVSLRKNSETTKASGQVVSLAQNRVFGVNGGDANIGVYVGGIYQTSFNLTVIRFAESVEVYPNNIQISAPSINLNYTIYPIDATASQVLWQVSNSNNAYIQNNVLYFNDYSKAEITATVDDELKASFSFYIERIESSIENLPPTEDSFEMFVGEVIQIAQEQNAFVEYEVLTENNKQVISVGSGGIIKAVGAGQAQLKYYVYNNYNVLIKSYNIEFVVYDTVKQIHLSNQVFEFYNGEFLTALSENTIEYTLQPSQNVKTQVVLELLDTNIAQLENGVLKFFGEGIVRLKATSEDGFAISVWQIRYTAGYARGFELNTPNTINIEKGTSTQIEVVKWIPFNTLNKNVALQTLSPDALQFIQINQNTVTGLKGGSVQVILRVSDILTRTLTINIFENVESVKFVNEKVLTAETSYLLTPTILPTSATNKTLVYEVDNNQIATVSNNRVLFNFPGTIVVTGRSVANPNVFDTIEITSTMGYPNSITLNSKEVKLFNGEEFSLIVNSYTPSQAGAFEVVYQVVSSHQTGQEVVFVNQSGVITSVSVGTAVVRVSVLNPYGIEVYEDVEVTVLPVTNNLRIDFLDSISTYNNMYVTASKNIHFEIVSLPTLQKTTDYQISYYPQNIATVNQGVVEFNQTGILFITFTSLLNSNANVQVSINYVGNTYLYVEVNESDFEIVSSKKQASVLAGSTFEFSVINGLPSNITNKQVVITEVSSTPNVSSLKVAEIEDGKIKMLNGGFYEINLTINGYNKGNYTFEVVRKATSISVASSQVFISVPYYEIFASFIPQDTSNKTIIYSSLNTNIATVNALGQVEFTTTGTAEIILISVANNLTKTISINYTKQVQSIVFENSDITLSVNSTLLLMPQTLPAGVDNFKILYVSDNLSVATVNESGRVFTTSNEGVATITAFIEGNLDVFAKVKITSIKYVTNIALELDAVEDNQGIAQKRVFGQYFYTNSGEIVNTYQMKVLSILPLNSTDVLIWSSSNEDVATVNENGLVTFLSVGEVTIRVQPKNQYNPTRPVYDSYKFTVVNGINTTTFEQFVLNMRKENPISTVLQNNVSITSDLIQKHSISTIDITADIHGNGHTISLAGLNTEEFKLKILKNSITIDNVVMKSENMNAGSTLDDMVKTNTLLLIWHAEDVLIKNSIFENANTLVRVFSSQVTIAGTIFQNAGFAHIQLSHTRNARARTIATVRNTVYKDALVAAIVFDFDESTTNEYASHLIVEEAFLVYNFRQPTEIMSPSLMEKMPELLRNIITSNAGTFLGFLDYIKHTYNSKSYFNMAILAIDVNYVVSSMASPGTVDMTKNTTNYYRPYEATNSITGFSATLRMYTIMPGNNALTPESTFDSSIYKTIREN